MFLADMSAKAFSPPTPRHYGHNEQKCGVHVLSDQVYFLCVTLLT